MHARDCAGKTGLITIRERLTRPFFTGEQLSHTAPHMLVQALS